MRLLDRHPGQGQSDPVQSLARRAVSSARTGSTIEHFAEIVNHAGYARPIRTPRGRDIMAACGQLKSASIKQRASARLAKAGILSRTRDPSHVLPHGVGGDGVLVAVAVALAVLFALGAVWVGDELRKRRPTIPCCNRERRYSARCYSSAR